MEKRNYETPLEEDWDDEVYTVEEWEEQVNNGWIWNDCGVGYWVKEGMKSKDEVFSTDILW